MDVLKKPQSKVGRRMAWTRRALWIGALCMCGAADAAFINPGDIIEIKNSLDQRGLLLPNR